MKELFKQIPTVKFEGSTSANPFAFKHYNKDEVIAGKTMSEHLKFAMAYWHTMCAEGTDMFGMGTIDKNFNQASPIEAYKQKVYAMFELMNKLSIDYFCFHDRDIAPAGETLAETYANLDIIVDLIEEQMKLHNKKVLWGTANCTAHKRYMHGAATTCDADVFAFAAAHIKKTLEITVRLGGTGFVFWGGREGYETLLNTNMGLELDNMARLMKMAVEYGRSIGFKGDFYIEPKPKEPTKHQYDFDVSTVLAFLRKYNLDKDFKMNIEANHATLAGHSFQHELRVARENGVFGSIDANQGDLMLGWDTDQFPTNIYDTTMCMYETLKAGGFTNGGLNFDAKVRRASQGFEDIAYGHIVAMDSFALGLKLAVKLIDDGRLDSFVKERYASFETGIGADIVAGKAGFKELEQYALNMGEISNYTSGRQEYLEGIINSVMFTA